MFKVWASLLLGVCPRFKRCWIQLEDDDACEVTRMFYSFDHDFSSFQTWFSTGGAALHQAGGARRAQEKVEEERAQNLS